MRASLSKARDLSWPVTPTAAQAFNKGAALVVSRKEYMLWSRDSDGYLALMNPITGSVRQDLRLPAFPATIETDFVVASKAAAQQDKILYVTVIAAMGQEAISAGFKIVD